MDMSQFQTASSQVKHIRVCDILFIIQMSAMCAILRATWVVNIESGKIRITINKLIVYALSGLHK